MSDADRKELKRRLVTLAPLFGDLGARTIETYIRGGILDAIAEGQHSGFLCELARGLRGLPVKIAATFFIRKARCIFT